jgi:predicted DNA-binding transcriptional regulator AlpA
MIQSSCRCSITGKVDTVDRHQVLVALGPGGTTDLAERVLELLQAQPAPVPELGGLAEVCAVLGRSRQTVGHWISGRRGPGGFPEPLVVLSATPVWDLAQVREWSRNVDL